MMIQYMLADKVKDNLYSASEISDNFRRWTENMEYGDVVSGEFQIWEYPSGKIFDVVPDRYALDNQDYSTPNSETWLPELKYAHTNSSLVAKEYERLRSLSKESKF